MLQLIDLRARAARHDGVRAIVGGNDKARDAIFLDLRALSVGGIDDVLDDAFTHQRLQTLEKIRRARVSNRNELDEILDVFAIDLIDDALQATNLRRCFDEQNAVLLLERRDRAVGRDEVLELLGDWLCLRIQ